MSTPHTTIGFEWRYQTRQISFVAALVGFVFGALVLVGTAYAPPGVNLNSPYAVMQSLGLLSLFSVFCLTFFCVNGALRDAEHGMTEIVYATPIGKPQYLGAGIGGALIAALGVMLVAALVLMIAPFLLHVDPARVGDMRPAAYLWAMLIIVLPNLVLVGALLFALATLTRSTLATYVGGVAIYALYWVSALLVDSPLLAGTSPTAEGLARAAILDPFGLSAFYEQTRYWTVPARNVQMIAFTGHLLINRLLYLGVSVAVLAMVYALFAFRVSRTRFPGLWRSAPTTRAKSEAPAQLVPIATYTSASPATDGVGAFWPALRSTTLLELRLTLRSWIFLALVALWVFMIGMEAVSDLGTEYGTHIYATTGRMLDSISDPLAALGTVTILYYAAELAWRERLLGVAPLVDVTSAPGAVFYLSKAIALCALPVVLALVSIAVGIGVQLAHGYYQIEPGVYLTVLWFTVVPLCLYAFASLTLQAVSPNRWIGMLACIALVLLARRAAAVGLEHPMWRFGVGPVSRYSDMDGFGGVGNSFAAFMLYWGALTAVLACIGSGVWRRGVDTSLGVRLLRLPSSLGVVGTRMAVGSAVLFLVAGSALYYEVSVAHEWRSSGAAIEWSADYERAYRGFADRPQPGIVAVVDTIALYPGERRASVRGAYLLENRTFGPIDTIMVTVPRGVATSNVTVSNARVVRDDVRFGVRTFALGQPLAPGSRTQLAFAVTIDRSGIRADAPDRDVTANGTYLAESDAFPVLGYRAGYELRDSVERVKAGLVGAPSSVAARSSADSLHAVRGSDALNPAWATFNTVVSTSADQTALSPGELVGAWDEGDRNYFHYVLDRPVAPVMGVLSARYAVRREKHHGVTVEVWYHPEHTANIDRILAAAELSLDVLGKRYGAYPRPTLRIAEVPQWNNFGGYAMPGLILFTENRGFLSDLHPGDVDLVTRRVAHEVAHQWWGHRLDPADVTGGLLMVETLAKNSEQLVIEKMYGERALPHMLKFDEDRYLSGRAEEADSEPALVDMVGEDYLYYGKGAIVMNGLRNLLGEAGVDSALNNLLVEHGGEIGVRTAPATSDDMEGALLRYATSRVDSTLVREWLGGRTLYELKVDTATVKRVADGRFHVVAILTALKTARRGNADVPESMDGEMIDVAMYDGDFETGRLLHEGKYRVVNGHVDVVLDLENAPEYIAVDPYVRRIDRDRSNNEKRVVVVR